MPLRFVAFMLVGSSLFASGCGPPGSSALASTPARATASARDGMALSTAYFSTVVPAGWTNKLGDAVEVRKFSSASGYVEFLAEQGPPGQGKAGVNDVIANVNVVLLANSVPDDQLAAFAQSVSSNGATNLSAPQSFTIDGATGQFITYDRDIEGTPGESQDMIINHGGGTFDIVLNASQFAFTQQESGLQAVLAAWRWTS